MKEFLLLIEKKYKWHSAIILAVLLLILFLGIVYSKGFSWEWFILTPLAYLVLLWFPWNVEISPVELPKIDENSSSSIVFIRIIMFLIHLLFIVILMLEEMDYKTIIAHKLSRHRQYAIL